MSRMLFAGRLGLLAMLACPFLARPADPGGAAPSPDEGVPLNLAAYKCHKIVSAGQIHQIQRDGVDADLFLVEAPAEPEGAISVALAKDWHPEAEVGGYLVQYADGYLSYSPAEPFEQGYSPNVDIDVDAAQFETDTQAAREKREAEEQAAADHLAALQVERNKLADDIVRLSNGMVEMGLASPMADGIPYPVVDAVLHHLALKEGYMKSLEAATKIILDLQAQIAATVTAAANPVEVPESEPLVIKHLQGRRRLVPRNG